MEMVQKRRRARSYNLKTNVELHPENIQLIRYRPRAADTTDKTEETEMAVMKTPNDTKLNDVYKNIKTEKTVRHRRRSADSYKICKNKKGRQVVHSQDDENVYENRLHVHEANVMYAQPDKMYSRNLKVISKGFDFIQLKQTLIKGTDCRKPHQIILKGSGDSLICKLVFYFMNIH